MIPRGRERERAKTNKQYLASNITMVQHHNVLTSITYRSIDSPKHKKSEQVQNHTGKLYIRTYINEVNKLQFKLNICLTQYTYCE